MRKFLLVLPLLALTGACAQLGAGVDIVRNRACDDTLEERFARKVLFDKYLVADGVVSPALDCDGDGVPDDLGRWVPPGE